jgi:hypothetical protein
MSVLILGPNGAGWNPSRSSLGEARIDDVQRLAAIAFIKRDRAVARASDDPRRAAGGHELERTEGVLASHAESTLAQPV